MKIYRNEKGTLKDSQTSLLVVGKNRIVNPTSKDFKDNGYKLVEDIIPTVKENQQAVFTGYVEFKDKWVKKYEVIDNENNYIN